MGPLQITGEVWKGVFRVAHPHTSQSSICVVCILSLLLNNFLIRKCDTKKYTVSHHAYNSLSEIEGENILLYKDLKGYWTSLTSFPNFFLFIPLEVLALLMTAVHAYSCLLVWLTFEEIVIFLAFYSIFFKINFNKYPTVVYGTAWGWCCRKKPHKVKMHWQNQLKSWTLVSFIVLYRIRHKKIDVILV